MSITLSLEKRKQILIQNLHFQKGEYTINLKDCNFQSDYYIKNFPCDCLIIEEKKNKKYCFFCFLFLYLQKKNYSYEKNIIIFTLSDIPNFLFL